MSDLVNILPTDHSGPRSTRICRTTIPSCSIGTSQV